MPRVLRREPLRRFVALRPLNPLCPLWPQGGARRAPTYDRAVRRERPRLWRRLRLSRQILLLQLAIIVLTLGTGVAVSILQARKQLDRGSGRQSLAIARTVAQIPAVRRAVVQARPSPVVQAIAERIRE